MTATKLLTAAEMHAMVASQQADLELIETTINEKMANGPAAAQAKRLVAYGLAKQAATIFKDAAGSVQYMRIKEDPAQAEKVKEEVKAQVGAASEQLGAVVGEDLGANLGEVMGEMVGGLVDMVEGLAEQVAEAMGVKPEAVAPSIVETTSILLTICGDMISMAKTKLEEADAAEAAVNQN